MPGGVSGGAFSRSARASPVPAQARPSGVGPGAAGQVAENPPSTQMTCPVTYPLAGLARKTAAPSKSAGSPLRPIMVRADIAADLTGSAATAAFSGVGTKPGQIALQHTPRGAQASDYDLVSDARPPLDAP